MTTTLEPITSACDIAIPMLRILALVHGHQATAAAIMGGSNEATRKIVQRLVSRGLIVTRRHGEHTLTQAGWTALAYDDRRA